MVEKWLELIACPYCRSPLRLAAEDCLACSGCAADFPLQDQIPILLRQQDLAKSERFSRLYRNLRREAGWQPLSRKQLLQLPFGRPPGYPALYWRVRRQSYQALRAWLRSQEPARPQAQVADLGAGNGWLSHRLSRAGYRLMALDISLDEDFGLRAGGPGTLPQQDYLRVQADLQHLPLPSGSYQYLIYNASLHYAQNLADALAQARRTLLPGGFVIILDSPIAKNPPPAAGLGDRQLGAAEIQHALTEAGLQPSWKAVRRGLHWWLYQFQRRLVGQPRFHFPLVVAQKG